jgi:hypothetical protein
MQLQDICREPVGGAGQVLDLAEVALSPVDLLGGKGACQELVDRTFAMYSVPRPGSVSQGQVAYLSYLGKLVVLRSGTVPAFASDDERSA